MTVDICSGIHEGVSSEIRISPNPASNLVRIEFPRNSVQTIVLIDLSGKVVRYNLVEESSQGISFDLESLSAGMYIVKLQRDDFTVNKKLIVR